MERVGIIIFIIGVALCSFKLEKEIKTIKNIIETQHYVDSVQTELIKDLYRK